MHSSFDCSLFVPCFCSSSSSLLLQHGDLPSILHINLQEAVAKQLRPLASMVQVCGATFVHSLYSLLQRKVPLTMSTFKYCAILILQNLQKLATYCSTPKCTSAGITKLIKDGAHSPVLVLALLPSVTASNPSKQKYACAPCASPTPLLSPRNTRGGEGETRETQHQVPARTPRTGRERRAHTDGALHPPRQ